MVILITNKEDVSADFVIRELRDRELPFWRFNTEDAPQTRFSLEPVSGLLRISVFDKVVIANPSFGSIWFRRPGRIELPSDEVASWFANDQWQRLILGFISLPGFRWVNEPFNNDRAECKILQLRIAKQVGLTVPTTLVTNSADALAEFRKCCPNGAIVKALYAPAIEYENTFVFTRLLSPDDTPTDQEMALAPVICQEALTPKEDIRATVVGEKVLAARLRREHQLPIDWRQSSHELPWESATLPEQLCHMLIEFTRRLGLAFAGIDMVYHRDRYYFIEVNPNGEWGWLQTGVGLPIASAIVDELVRRG